MTKHLSLLLFLLSYIQMNAKEVTTFMGTETQQKSDLWPNINADLFFTNLDNNLQHTIYLNQGKSTNFCGFAAITYHLIKRDPDVYKRMILELYYTGTTITPNGRKLKVSKEIYKYAGTLKNKGVMDINHADQLWFMTLADNYKGYLNWFNLKYRPGAERKMWASTNYGKFNRMLHSLTGDEVYYIGTDLIRPLIKDFYHFVKELQATNTVILYLNSNLFSPSNFSNFPLPVPTHFVELYDIQETENFFILEYWDYGLRTKVQITKKKFKRLIYGISVVSKLKD